MGETLFRVYLTTRTGTKLFLYIWGTDALDAVNKIQGVLIGQGCEYTLTGCAMARNGDNPLTR